MKPEPNRPIAIEDLLRLKRAERPPPEFWNDFDRALRAKQLSALVAKRPWWQTLPKAFSGAVRYRIPLGATAVLALTFVTLRSYHVPSPVSEQVAPVEAQSAVALAAEGGVSADVNGAEQKRMETLAAPHAVEEISVSPALEPVESVADAGDLSRMIPSGGALATDNEAEPQSPSARTIAANLATVQAAETSTTRGLLGAAGGFETRGMPARNAVEPLQQMATPGDTRRSRLLTAMVSRASLESSVSATERVASRIAEDRLYDQIHRFGARGDRLQVKF